MGVDGRARALRSALICLALAGTTATANAQEDRQGYYVGIEMGAMIGSPLGTNMRAVSHPTRCDRLLYHGSVAYPAGDPACTDNTPRDFLTNRFVTGGGFASGLVLGYAVNVLHFEVEYLRRLHGNDTAPAGTAANVVLSGKDTEWSNEQPPSESIRDYNAHQLFFNAYYDLLNDSPWTPYAGVGIGWAATNLNYANQFVRKPADEYLQIAFDPDWPAEAKRAAAGTISHVDTTAGRNIFGYQLLAGADYALTENTSIGATLRLARFEGFEDEATWNLVRSHAPVIADGVTPFDSQLEFEDIGYQAVTVNLKYRF